MPNRIFLPSKISNDIKNYGENDLLKDTYSSGILMGFLKHDTKYVKMKKLFMTSIAESKKPSNGLAQMFVSESTEYAEKIEKASEEIKNFALEMKENRFPYFTQLYINMDVYDPLFHSNRVPGIEIEVIYDPKKENFDVLERKDFRDLDMEVVTALDI